MRLCVSARASSDTAGLRAFSCCIATGFYINSRPHPRNPALAHTDERPLRQVLHNLLDNAVKYTDAGQVRLKAERDPPASAEDETLTLLFTVADTGRGIAPADRERLFAPFEQYHHAAEGSGLGLAICRDIADLLHGELTLDSAPGLGSRFSLRLPAGRVAAPPAESEPDTPPILGYQGPRRRILVIDDSAENRLLLVGMVGQLALDPDSAASATEALALARRQPPDLEIADLRMPEVCGYAALWQLRGALGQPRLPAIAASASPLPEPGDAAELGFDAFLLKPIELNALIAAIGACLGLRWVQTDAEPTAASPRADNAPRPKQPTRPPPRLELEAALELAESADWPELTYWCEQITDA